MAFTPHPPPAIQQGWARALVFFIVYLGIYFLVSALAGFVWGLQHQPAAATTILTDPYFPILILAASAVLSIVVAFLFRRLVDRQSIASMGFTWKGHQRDAWAGFLLGLILLGIGSLVLFFSHHINWTDTRPPAGAIITGLVLFGLTAFSEEIIFRGYILNNMLASLPRWPALGAVSVLFAVTHFANAHLNPVAIVNLLAGGFLLGLNYVFTRNLWFSVFFHFSWNFFQGSVLGYAVSGLDLQSLWTMERKGDELLTGGAFGFEGSAVATGLLLLAIYFCGQRKWWV